MYNKIYDYLGKKFKSKGIILSKTQLKKIVQEYIIENNLQKETPKNIFKSILLNFVSILYIVLSMLDNKKEIKIVKNMINEEFNKLCNEFNKLEQKKKYINNDLDI